MRKVGGVDIRSIVADDEWQRLRSSFVGTWRTRSDDNVRQLRAYLDANAWGVRPVIRVLNYLTGTAFRIGSIASPLIDELREEVRAANARHKESS